MSKFKLEKLVAFELNDGQDGVETERELLERCEQYKTTIHKQSIATYEEVEWEVCCGSTIEEGTYLIEDGLLEVNEDGELFLINFRKVI